MNVFSVPLAPAQPQRFTVQSHYIPIFDPLASSQDARSEARELCAGCMMWVLCRLSFLASTASVGE
jgi:hypothetical protein